ncbi:unnamed protein product [Adineta steineri]|uniref:G-protein coupled receptors family 1 profile domain-containing protein n=1 Tax=Adineta steineri TaxID=433720 RepID=A0A814X3N9_9BILA|nr:unnamed protein product [Adineta steineri]CAF0781128.1 unnamed protein product [Adineta steineri]CAF0925091.1 unnamed protein product [Adineta steineri]CAF1106331.1 unnamed protein product [Adineta steineri]CAF1209021.1 unnamed protein product [Adineta steineri]
MSKLLDQVRQANIYLQPVQFSLAIIANIINIRVLCSRVLRKSPCTHYFLAYAVFNTIYTCLICPTLFLNGFYIDWTSGKIGCKIHAYILILIPFQANLMLILASFDRYCSSSRSRRIHSRSTIQKTRINIISGTILSAIYMSPMLIIYKWNEIHNKCLQQTNILISIYIFSQVFLYYVLLPLLMMIFGFMTISNIRRQSIRALPMTGSMRRRRTEGQLARMLILQIVVHLILVLPYGIIYCMNSIEASTRTPTVLAIRIVFLTWQQCDYFVSFFLYIFSASVYRRELIRILKVTKTRQRSTQSFAKNRTDIYRDMSLITTTTLSANETINNAFV